MKGYVEKHEAVKKIVRIAKKHHRQAENCCNGRGWLNGKFYTLAALDAYELKQYPYAISGYLDGKNDRTFFCLAMDKYEFQIKTLLPKGFTVEFQGDPRGYTVKLTDETGRTVNY